MFHYYRPSRPPRPDTARTLVATIPAGAADEKQLMSMLGGALYFPRHYGENFDAFWDCATTMEVADGGGVALVHEDLPPLPGDQRETYVALLRDTVAFWQRHRKPHRFDVWFPRSAEAAVTAILATLSRPGG